MENVPEPPDGYKEPQRYELENWKIAIVAVVNLSIFFVIFKSLNARFLLPNEPVSNLTALGFAVAATLYLHESMHYVVADFFGYEPKFVWPNRVDFGVEILRTRPTVASLLAPQLLSVLYVELIYVGVAPVLEIILVISLLLNLFAGAADVCWAIRRLSWPRGTVFINDGDEGYVAFLKD